MNSNIGLKISNTAQLAKVVSIIRSYESLSIADIKQRISSNQYLLEYEYTDEDGLKKIINCYSKLEKTGISAQLYEHDNPCDIQLLKNLNGMYKDISDQINAEIAAEEDGE